MTGSNKEKNILLTINKPSKGSVLGSDSLQSELKSYFYSHALSPSQRESLESLLLNTQKSKGTILSQAIFRNKKTILSHFATAAAAVFLTIGISSFFNSSGEQSSHDILSEVVGFSENLKIPTDFTLDSNLNNLHIPLRLQDSLSQKKSSTVYIVKLSDKNNSSFPSHRMTRKILSASGKIKRVYAWRDATYGYAMVQPLELEEQ